MTSNPPIFMVDFNEMLEKDLVLFSAIDEKKDVKGLTHILAEAMKVQIQQEDFDDVGIPAMLNAEGILELNNTGQNWAKDIKWSCRISNDRFWHTKL